MKAEFFSDSHYNTILMSWWRELRGADFNPAMQANHGIVVKNKQGVPLALCFVYFPSNSKMCQLAFITRNPVISPYASGKAIKLLVSYALYACRSLGYTVLYTASADKAIQKLFSSSDFKVDEQQSLEFIKEL